jgi:hypothetical protein
MEYHYFDNYVSPFIWCPEDQIKTKDGWISNSVGPRQHYHMCLASGCYCDRLEEKMEEINAG